MHEAPLALRHQYARSFTVPGTGLHWLGSRLVRALSVLILAGVLSACGQSQSVTLDAFSETGRVIAMGGGAAGPKAACFACHGLDGNGDRDAAPGLAGLDAGYLHKQLSDYAAGTRTDDEMSWIAKRLDDTT